MPEARRTRPSEWTLLGLLSLLWGGSFFFSKVALSELPPLTVVLARVGLAAGALWLLLRLRGIPIPTAPATWVAFLGMGLLNSPIPFSLIADGPWLIAPLSLTVWASLAGLALLSTALAYILFFHLLATVGATNTSLVTLLIPVSAILLGVLFLEERPSASQLSGMGLIGLGLLALDGRVFGRRG